MVSINPDLRGRGMEDEIMQDVFVRLLKITVTHFLSQKDINGESNIHPDKFQAWITTVAKKHHVRCRKSFEKERL